MITLRKLARELKIESNSLTRYYKRFNCNLISKEELLNFKEELLNKRTNTSLIKAKKIERILENY